MSSDLNYSAYDYRITEVMRIVDGDTYDLRIDLGFHMSAALRFRLYGYDTPEVYGKNASEEGKQATQFVEMWLGTWQNSEQFIELRARTYKADSFGRWLAEIYVVYELDGEVRTKDLGEALFNEGLATEYDG